MNLTALKNRFWWIIDDDPANPRLMDATTLESLIEEARQDYADRLQYVKEANGAVARFIAGTYITSTGVVTMPTDFLMPLRVLWGGSDLDPVTDIQMVTDIDGDTIGSYMLTKRKEMQLFGRNDSDLAKYLAVEAAIVVAQTEGLTGTPASIVDAVATYASGQTGTNASAVIAAAAAAAILPGATPTTVAAAARAAAVDTNGGLCATAAETEAADSDSTVETVVEAAALEYLTTEDYDEFDEVTAAYASGAAADDATVLSTLTAISTYVPTLSVWYIAYPPTLTAGTSPDEIPEEYHQFIVTLYVRAQYCQKMGWLNQYGELMGAWDDIKDELFGTADARQRPVRTNEGYQW